MNKRPVFICYRQTDGKTAATRVFRMLHDPSVRLTPQSGAQDHSALLDACFVQAAPGIADWTAVHEPCLKRARAMIVICTPGSKLNEGRQDRVHREIHWWLNNREMAPILVDPLGGFVPRRDFKREALKTRLSANARENPWGLLMGLGTPHAIAHNGSNYRLTGRGTDMNDEGDMVMGFDLRKESATGVGGPEWHLNQRVLLRQTDRRECPSMLALASPGCHAGVLPLRSRYAADKPCRAGVIGECAKEEAAGTRNPVSIWRAPGVVVQRLHACSNMQPRVVSQLCFKT